MSGIYDMVPQGFPFAINEIENLNNDTIRAMRMALELMQGFDPSQDYIVKGIVLGGGQVSEGFAYLNGQVVYVPTVATAEPFANLGIRPNKATVEQVLWEDGQTRDSRYEAQGEVVTFAGNPDEVQLSSLTRLTGRWAVPLEPDFAGPLYAELRDGCVEFVGNVTYSGAPNLNVTTKFATLPTDIRPSALVGFPGLTVLGASASGLTIIIDPNGDVSFTGTELTQNERLITDRGAWSI